MKGWLLKRTLSMVVTVMLVVGLLPSALGAAHGAQHLRVAHLSPTAPTVDVYVNGTVAIKALSYPNVSDYLSLETTEIMVQVVPAGKALTEAVLKEPVTLKWEQGDEGFYTAATVGSLSDGTFALVLLPADGSSDSDKHNDKDAKIGSAKVDQIQITGAWARATGSMTMEMSTPEATPAMNMGGDMHMSDMVSAAYMTINNLSDKADRLIKVESEAAMMVTLHETKVVNDVAQMVPQENGFEVPAKSAVELKPGGKHIMLEMLSRDLQAGETLTLKLTFESGTVVELLVPIVAP